MIIEKNKQNLWEQIKGLNAFFLSMPENFYLVMAPDLNTELSSATKPVIVDVRTAEDFAKGYVEGSINIPIVDLAENLSQLPADKATPIVVTCQSGHRGAIGMMALHMPGYTNVRSLFLGMNGWTDAKLPVVTE